MAPNVNTPLLGYPTDFGNKHYEIFDHLGPASYANIGTSSGKGDIIKATDLGWGGFDRLSPSYGSYSFTGNYFVKVFTNSSGTTPSITQGNQTQRVLQWFTTSAAFGAVSTEVTNATNLSAEKVRFEAVGV